MCLPSPVGLGGSLLRVYFGRCSRKGLFLCNGKAAAGHLLGVSLVDLRQQPQFLRAVPLNDYGGRKENPLTALESGSRSR